MISHVIANEILCAFASHICGLNYHDCCVKRVKGHIVSDMLVTFGLFKRQSHQTWLSKSQLWNINAHTLALDAASVKYM